MKNGGFDPEYTESEKQRLYDEIEAKINEKGAYAARRMYEIMFEGEAGAISKTGYMEDVPGIDPVSEYGYYKELISECPVIVYGVGNMDMPKLETAVTAMFKDIPRSVRPLTRTVQKEHHLISCVRKVVEEMEVQQGKLAMGYRANGFMSDRKRYSDLLLACEIFGSSPVAKLFMHVREKLNLCYDCSSQLSGALGSVFVYAGIDTKNLNTVLCAIDDMLCEVKNGEFDQSELDIAKKSIISAIRTGFDSPKYMIAFYISRLLAEVNDTPEALISRIEAATAEDVAAAAANMQLDTVYFLCGSKKAAEEQL